MNATWLTDKQEKLKYLKLMELLKSLSNKVRILVHMRQRKLLLSYMSSIFRRYIRRNYFM